MNDIMNSEEIKVLLKRTTEMMLPFYIASLKAKTRLAPTLSEILAEGSKRIDDAVQAVIARHEKEIADIEIKANIDFSEHENKLYNDLAMSQLYQQMGADQRDAMNQLQSGTWI